MRESRRVVGIDYIGVEAFEQAKKYPDAIARVRYPIDIHNPNGSGTILKKIADNDWYEILTVVLLLKMFQICWSAADRFRWIMPCTAVCG